MGKEVEEMSATEVAKMADSFFDRQGKPLEKSVNPINQVSNASSTASHAAASPYTSAFSDEDETDINFIKNSKGKKLFFYFVSIDKVY